MVILPYLYMDMSNSRDAEGIRNAALSVVNILATNSSQQNTFKNQREQNLIGSGIIISEDGYILTNLHIILFIKKLFKIIYYIISKREYEESPFPTLFSHLFRTLFIFLYPHFIRA